MKFVAKSNRVLAMLFLVSIPVFATPNIDHLENHCDAGKQKACRELAKLAEHDKDTSVRIEAIDRLKDVAVLSRIVQRELFPAVRQAAESRLKSIRSGK